MRNVGLFSPCFFNWLVGTHNPIGVIGAFEDILIDTVKIPQLVAKLLAICFGGGAIIFIFAGAGIWTICAGASILSA